MSPRTNITAVSSFFHCCNLSATPKLYSGYGGPPRLVSNERWLPLPFETANHSEGLFLLLQLNDLQNKTEWRKEPFNTFNADLKLQKDNFNEKCTE